MKERTWRTLFVVVQLVLFVCVTVVVIVFTYYFPNLPPMLRPFVAQHRIAIEDVTKKTPDQRFLAWFNRDPERNIPTEDNIIVSPADGFVLEIKPFQGKKHIVIEMRYTDVHVQRIPISGKILRIEGEGNELQEGVNIGDYHLEKMLPFQKVTIIDSPIGDVVVRQITSFFAKRIEVFVEEGQSVEIGRRLGRVLAGSTVVIELPDMVDVLVKKEDIVVGGETIIARY